MFEPLEVQESFQAKAEKREPDYPELTPISKGLGLLAPRQAEPCADIKPAHHKSA